MCAELQERGEARRMGVAVAVAWQRWVGAACVPSDEVRGVALGMSCALIDCGYSGSGVSV